VPGRKLTVDEYFGWMFENTVPGLPEAAAAEGLSPLDYMRKYGAFEMRTGAARPFLDEPNEADVAAAVPDEHGILRTDRPAPGGPNITPVPVFSAAPGGRPVGITRNGAVRTGFPTPSRLLELYSETVADWGWPEHAIPGYVKSHVAPELVDRAKAQFVLIPTFRLPTLIHTRSANSKWLVEISHKNPVWIHPSDGEALGVGTDDLIRVATEIGHFVARAWLTEGIRPGVVACSHHMGRWRLHPGANSGWASVPIDLASSDPGQWHVRQRHGAAPFESTDPDSRRVWWTDVGVHQNLTFPVHPDPVSGMHCWHQLVQVSPAEPTDRLGDVFVDTNASHDVYKKWLALARPARTVSPDGLRRPHWLLRPFRPSLDAYRLPKRAPVHPTGPGDPAGPGDPTGPGEEF
jgi:hypothetical protein